MEDTEPVSLRPWAATDGPALRRAYESTPDLSTQFGEVVLASDGDAAAFVRGMLGFGEAAQNWAIVRDGIAVGNVGLGAIEWRHQTVGRITGSLRRREVADTLPGR